MSTVLRRARALLVALLLAGVLGAVGASSAAAVAVPAFPIPGLPDCQSPPPAQAPDRGFGGFITPTPLEPPPLDVDPFTEGSGVSLYETTGLAGYRWHMYTDSCITGPGQATNQALTSAANSLLSIPVLAVGLVATLADVVYNQAWLAVLDEPVAYVSDALYEGFTQPFMPVVVIVVGVVLLAGIRRARLSAALGTGVLVLVAGTLAAFAVNYPTRVADLTDQVTSTAVVSVNGAIAGSGNASPAVATVSPLVESILYDRWVAGTLGDTTSPTAREYGPVLYDASTLTWAETELVRSDPGGAGEDLIEAKQEQWREAADAVQESDPDAYEYLTGARSLDRVGHALVAFALISILPFLAMSLLLVAMSYLIIRLIVMFLPLVALLALVLRGTLHSLGSLAASAIINSVVFAVGAAVTAYLYGVFLSPDSGIPALLGILLAFLVSIALWILLSPYRRLTSMVRGTDAVKQSKREVERVKGNTRSFAMGAGKVALGVFAGNKAADAANKLTTSEEQVAEDGRYREGPGAVRPELFAVDRNATTGPPAALPSGGGQQPVAIAPRRVHALAGRPTLPAGTGAPAPERGSTSVAVLDRDEVSAGHVDADVPRGGDRRPELTPLRDFDPVVVDGEAVSVLHTLDGAVVDLPDATGPVVPGSVIATRDAG